MKRCFFGFKIFAPWPKLPKNSRVLTEENRHVTLAFLGDVSSKQIEELHQVPLPAFCFGPVGTFDRVIFLPKKSPRLVAWNIRWQDAKMLNDFLKRLQHWLKKHDFMIQNRKMLWHVTMCRNHFKTKEWQQNFFSLPFIVDSFNLYESLKDSNYQILWSHNFLKPFEETEHTADLAFSIRGKNFTELYYNAQLALAFNNPAFLPFCVLEDKKKKNIEDVVIGLNELIFEMDKKIGSPFKAVSFHKNIKSFKDNLLEWEMIVDV